MSLAGLLTSIDGAGYGAYKKITGAHDVGAYRLHVDKVQSDPYAPPSLIQVTAASPVPDALRSFAARDFLNRRIADACSSVRGLLIDVPGQQVLERAAVLLDEDTVTIRMEAQLPARGRKILGRQARTLLCDKLPQVLDEALDIDLESLTEAVELERDQNYLRSQLASRGLVSFIGNGSSLPRSSGHRDAPASKAVAFESPSSLEVSVDLPSGRSVSGMGVPKGVTVIVGGGYHGKSTLLKAMERGVYNHIGGDGREFAITTDDAMSLRAEDGRSVDSVDISQFISNLPTGTDTTAFSTDNASGSTSQAAALVEALEAGSSTLLIDEDTSATNFMIRDHRMRELIPTDKEPITPLVDRVRALSRTGVSTVLVAGGSAAFIDVADTVIHMDSYRAFDITERAHSLARPVDEPSDFPAMVARQLKPKRFQAKKPPQAKGAGIRVGRGFIDIAALSQLVDGSQTRSIAAILAQLSNRDGAIGDLVDEVLAVAAERGIDALSRHKGHPGRLAMPRKNEVMATINRARKEH